MQENMDKLKQEKLRAEIHYVRNLVCLDFFLITRYFKDYSNTDQGTRGDKVRWFIKALSKDRVGFPCMIIN